jgi:hypothetical protein
VEDLSLLDLLERPGHKPLPPVERLRELFDLRGGELYWRVRPSPTAGAGARAGYLKKTNGYRYIKINGSDYLEHRIIWKLHNGRDPGHLYVDHIDGDALNNKPQNLRLATNSQNQRNRARSASNNSSGITGVYWDARRQKWRARIMVNGKHNSLGHFASADLARGARRAAELKFFGEYAPQCA